MTLLHVARVSEDVTSRKRSVVCVSTYKQEHDRKVCPYRNRYQLSGMDLLDLELGMELVDYSYLGVLTVGERW